MRSIITALTAAAGLTVAVPATATAAPALATAPMAIPPRELRQYASALFQILTARQIADREWRAAPIAQRPALRQQASAALTAILNRYRFTQARFNQISAAVERQPALRRQVRDQVMREGLGYD